MHDACNLTGQRKYWIRPWITRYTTEFNLIHIPSDNSNSYLFDNLKPKTSHLIMRQPTCDIATRKMSFEHIFTYICSIYFCVYSCFLLLRRYLLRRNVFTESTNQSTCRCVWCMTNVLTNKGRVLTKVNNRIVVIPSLDELNKYWHLNRTFI